MKYFRLACGCLFCLAVFAMTACKPKPRYQMVGEPSPEQPPATSSLTSPAQLPTPSPLPSQPSEGQAPGLATLASSVRPAIILVTVFDASGKLLRTGTGFFVADDGKFVTNWRTAESGAYAVAKMGDGAICNVTGILASSTTLDLAVLKADVKGVPFLALNKIGKTDVDDLHTYGYGDEQILETVLMVGLAKFANFVSSGLGTRPDFDSSRVKFPAKEASHAASVVL